MKRPDALRPLAAVVQIRDTTGGGGSFWRTIAAFDVMAVADRYAEQCGENGLAEYRVVPLMPSRSR